MSLLPWHKELLVSDSEPDAQNAPDRLRKAFEQLGTTAIKLGQILSTRADLLPPEYLYELAKLRDSVPPVPTPAIRAVIEQEFNKPVEEIFAEFSDVPLAAASVGQVHVARLFSGEQVAVKIQKPGVAEQVEIDLQLLEELAGRAQRTSKIAQEFDLAAIIEEFAWTLRSELDYQREGRNADAFREQFIDNPDVVIPTIYWDFSSRRVLTMQLLSGFKIDDLAKLEELNIDRHDLALRSANLVLSEIFVHGFYHADPHPGNFLILEGAVIGALDFGMVGRISDEMKLGLLDLVAAAIARDPGRIVDSMEALGMAGVNDRRSTLVRDVGRMLERYVGLPLSEIDIGETIDTLFATIRRNQVRMPAELVMLLKTLVMVEGVGRYLDPDFNTLTEMTPFVQGEMRRRMHPKTWKPFVQSALGDLLRAGGDFPGQLRRFSRRLDQGDLTVSVRMRELDSSLHRLEGMVNRLALSILVSALIIGAALLIVAYHPGTDSGWLTALFAGGMVVAVLLALALIVSMIRSRRR
ncbi:AarF/ABC1/UbiB kinase family protein [soil metagenome]